MGEGKEYVSRPDEMGNIHISEEVLAVIAAAAAQEVDGVSSLAGGLSGDIAELVAGKKLGRGIDIRVNEESVTIRVAILVKYGYVIPDVGKAVQDAVMSAVENTTGLTVESVNVHVAGVTFPR
ncbi:MAG: Asp23/Gls24 family envelope stress response protein [Oscillospiraceae bacterium]